MFLSHFGLAEQPFQITPDPDFLYRSIDNRGAENIIQFSISQIAPLTVVTGEVGIGKTCLIRKFLNEAPDDLTIGLISNYRPGMDDLHTWVLSAFDQSVGDDGIDGFCRIERFLLEEFQAGRRCVLLIDEAQALQNDDLEQLRMLSNINDGHDTLLMLFLVGQPELRARMQLPENRLFAQRIATMAHLEPMSARDTTRYVQHRLQVAGATEDIFDDAALDLVNDIACGVPRIINVVCNLVMFEAFGEGAKRIDGPAMQRYLEDAERHGYLAHLSDIRVKSAIRSKPASAPPAAVASGTDGRHLHIVPKESAPSLRLVTPVTPSHDPAPQPASQAISIAPAATPVPPPVASSAVPVAKEPQPLILQDPLPARPSGRDRLPPLEPSAFDLGPMSEDSEPATGKRRGIGNWAALAACFAIGGAYMAVTQMPEGPIAALIQTAGDRNVATSDADIVSKGTAIPLSFTPATTAPLPDPGGAALIATGVELGATDPKAAAIAYARAALRGEKRAAYYLAQMYETGDGVPYDPTLARAWYALFPDASSSTQRRIDQLDAAPTTSKLTAPTPLLGGPLQDSAAGEFIWTGLSGNPKVQYVVELAQDETTAPQQIAETAVSATMIADLGHHAAAKLWRVVAVDTTTGAKAASDWQQMGVGAD